MLINTKGFTLMEILVVVTIIGILAAIAVPSYIYAVDKGKEDACTTNVQILSTQVERYRLVEGKFITLVGSQSLVDFLEQEGYFVGQQVLCPLKGIYQLQTETVGGVTTQKVICTHEPKE